MGVSIAVGGRYSLPAPAIEGLQLWLDPLILTFGLPALTEAEVEKFRAGRLHLFLQEADGLVHLAARSGIGWCDSFVAVQSSMSAELQPPPEEETMGYALSVLLVDTSNQIVRALRMVGLSREFSRGLYTLWLKHRNDEPLSSTQFHKKTAALMLRFQNPRELAQRAPYSYRTGDQS